MAEDAQLRHLVTALNKVKMMKIDPAHGPSTRPASRLNRPPSSRNSRPASGRPKSGRPVSARLAASLEAARRVYSNEAYKRPEMKLYAPVQRVNTAVSRKTQDQGDKAEELLRLLHRIELLQQSDRKGTLGHQKELAIMIQHGQKLAEECFAGCLGNLGLQLMELTGEQPPEIPTTEAVVPVVPF
ncbi:hypothetical protein CYMTET_17539 [Cymbomonas tetramitiformis]|uniref:Uncharacterized protein n=1 Tax=Cymbomonas tetramitiformis TaxID=36881 RepID=A0AAE0GA48_9CHLO|nr:hypothetical protein CYMTET_17539 [Cymbomonas tetramitiformis]